MLVVMGRAADDAPVRSASRPAEIASIVAIFLYLVAPLALGTALSWTVSIFFLLSVILPCAAIFVH